MIEIVQSKKRGRPATGVNQSIGVRLTPKTIEDLDVWRAKQPGVPGRPEAIRQLIEAGLKERQVDEVSGGSPPGSARKPAAAGKTTTPRAKKPTASDRQATAAQTKEAQIRALREQGAG
jgi:hypothetical protein